MLSMLEQELLSLEREWTQVSNTFNDNKPESLFRFMGLLHNYRTHCTNFMIKIHQNKSMIENRGGTKTDDSYAIDFTRGDINSLECWLKEDFQALDLKNFLQFVTVYVGRSFHGFDQMREAEIRLILKNYNTYKRLKHMCSVDIITKTLESYSFEALELSENIAEAFNKNVLHEVMNPKNIYLRGQSVNEFKRMEIILVDGHGQARALSCPLVNVFGDFVVKEKHNGKRRCKICYNKDSKITLHCFNCKENKICMTCFSKVKSNKCSFCTLSLFDKVMQNIEKFGMNDLVRFIEPGKL
jgi:hypothetical protein